MTGLLVAAWAAGMVSTVNPCGFAMLPAYLGYFLGGEERVKVGQVAAAVAAGFLAVFTVAGGLIGVGVNILVSAIPWLALAVGVGLVVIGVAQLGGRRLLPYLRGPQRVAKRRTAGGMFVFGASYAVASLSCTLPIFLSLVSATIATSGPVQAVAVFVAYGGGMAMVVVALTLAVGSGRDAVLGRVRSAARHLDRISGWIMVAAGGFIIWFWATVLSRGADALGANPLVRWIDETSARVTGAVADRPLLVVALLLALVGAWVLVSAARSGRSEVRPRDRVPERPGE